MKRSKPRGSYENRVAHELDKLGLNYQRRAKFRADNGTNIWVDFVIDEPRLIIEVDGAEHPTPSKRLYDQWRDDYLIALGYAVARVTHADLDTYTDALTHAIEHARHGEIRHTVADSADSVRLLRLYNAFCESTEFLLPGRVVAIQVTIQARNTLGAPTTWTFGRNRSSDADS